MTPSDDAPEGRERVVVVAGDASAQAGASVVVRWALAPAADASRGTARTATFTGPVDAVTAPAVREFVTEIFGGVDDAVGPAHLGEFLQLVVQPPDTASRAPR